MTNETDFKTWAIVEVMGHVEYAGFVSAENIAGAPMLRIDVPATPHFATFTKYIAPGALYGISPCTEETAKARAAGIRATPFNTWSVEQQIMEKLKSRGLLLDQKNDSGDEEDESC